MTNPLIRRHAPDGLQWTGALAVMAGLLFMSLLIVVVASGLALQQEAALSMRGLGTLAASLTIPRQSLLIGVSVVLAIIGGRLTSADAISGHLSDLRLMPITPAEIVSGYIMLTLYRVRYGVAAVAGTLPVIHLLTVRIFLLSLANGQLDAVIIISPLVNILTSVVATALIIITMTVMGVAFGLAFEASGVVSAGAIAFFLLLLLSVANNVLPQFLLLVLATPRLLTLVNLAVGAVFLIGFLVISIGGYIVALNKVQGVGV